MVLGIDLGTSNTVAATVSRDGAAVIIPDVNNKDLQSTPTKVLINNNRAYVGNFAENIFEIYPDKKLLSFFKRYFGTGRPLHVDEQQGAWFSEGLAALVLKKVINDVELYLPDGFEKCVITVPAHYNDIQRKSVYEAARLANLELSAIVDEPVAAALYYGSGHQQVNDELTLVYDFGGGTFDLTLITQNNNHLHVIAKDGIDRLGGKEFDEIVATEIKKGYQAVTGRSFPDDPLSQNRLQKSAEQFKIDINTNDLPLASQWMLIGRDAIEYRMITAEYKKQAAELIEKTGIAVNRCLRSMGLQLSDIQKIILIGGTSSSKLVFDYWLNRTKDTDTKVIYHQPLNSVAKGAALYAQSLTTKQNSAGGAYRPIELKSVSTYNIGLQPPGGSGIDLLIHRNSPLPVSAQRLFKITQGNAQIFSVDICQYWEEDDPQVLGTLQLETSIISEFLLELNLENKANGTIGLKLRNADTGADVKFSFQRKKSDFQYNYQLQKNLVDAVYLNNIS
jgi:molecular chaperone DnaK (HSP70)